MGLVAATRTGRAKSYSNESFFFFAGYVCKLVFRFWEKKKIPSSQSTKSNVMACLGLVVVVQSITFCS